MIGRLQVEDDRHRALELVGDLLGVVEVARDDEVDLDVGVAVADRAQRARARGRDRLVVGEDVVDLVAARAARGRQAAHLRSRSRRAFEGLFGAGLGLEVVLVLGAVVVILGEAEVDQRSMPCVA